MRSILSAVKARRREGPFRRLRTAIGAITLIVLTATAVSGISALADGKPGGSSEKKLVGSWMVTVDRGPSLPPLKSLQTFTEGHGVVEISNAGATVRSPSHGAWEHIRARNYAVTFVFFRYDPNSGACLGTVKLRGPLELAPDGQSFTAVSVAELRDKDGKLLSGSNTRRDTATAERINVEPIPEP